MRKRPALIVTLLLLAAAPTVQSQQASSSARHAVVLLYHHVSSNTPPSTSVTPAVFERHLAYLADHDFNVWPLERIAVHLREGRDIPPKTVALTFDDAYSSVYDVALPLLQQYGWPFTVFVATDYIRDTPGLYMSWAQLADLTRQGGAVANHSSSHEHLIRRRDPETKAEWRRRIVADVTAANDLLREKLSVTTSLFAYPYGEFDTELQALILEEGYIAFGQQSGPAGALSSLSALPRFPVATGFDDLDSLGEKLLSVPLPVSRAAPTDPLLDADAGPPVLKLDISKGAFRQNDLRCYVSNQQPAAIRWQGNTAVVTAREPLRAGRSKFTCTAPSTEHPGVYFWYTHLWIQMGRDGNWHTG